MNGRTTMGATRQKITTGVVLTGVLLTATGSLSKLRDSAGGKNPASAKLPEERSRAEGPWVASCDFWAPARPVAPTNRQKELIANPRWIINLDGSRSPEQEQVRVTKELQSTSEGEEGECGSGEQQRWGLPQLSSPLTIRTLIAIVPDPVHTNMALQFDRTIDSLTGAAGEYQYVSSYYWLPWKNQPARVSPSEERAVGQQPDATKNEHEPGLIILRCVAPRSSSTLPTSPPPCEGDVNPSGHVLYLFLVGETPTTGIDGLQIQKAFQYQNQLYGPGRTVFRSFRNDDPRNLAIIGPTYSGSAASLRQAVDTRLEKHDGVNSVSVNGITSTTIAANHLMLNANNIKFNAFSSNNAYSSKRLLQLLAQSSSTTNPTRVAVLVEDGTTFGNQTAKSEENEVTPIYIRFPRDISLLRNAQAENGRAESSGADGAAPSPYLHLSLKESNSYDSVPHLSRENTPLSQEAQLMTIARQLQRYDSQYIVISGSNILDLLFLAQFLHRACPDARLVFYNADLLFEREIDNVPFIGTITLTPYPLIAPQANDGDPTAARRAYTDSGSLAFFNAASYTMSGQVEPATPNPGIPIRLTGYRPLPGVANEELSSNLVRPPLWVTAIGSDGYYPLGIASDQASNSDNILPGIFSPPSGNKPSTPKAPIGPAYLWYFLCSLVLLICVSHAGLLCVADFWSPFTRELAVRQSDQPRRRSMYIHIATAMLFCMAFVVAFPLFPTFSVLREYALAKVLSEATLLSGVLAVITTFWKTRNYLRRQSGVKKDWPSLQSGQSLYFVFNVIAWVTLLAVPSLWIYLCCRNQGGGLSSGTSRVGLFFSFRCVHPGSGVSPLLPVLLLLLSWYLWAVFQTWRLRFSSNTRPMLPKKLDPKKLDPKELDLVARPPLFVADDDLEECEHSRSACLFRNITCLLITTEILHRFFNALRRNLGKLPLSDDQPISRVIGGLIVIEYLVFFASFVLLTPVTGLDAFLWALGDIPDPFELLIKALFLPLLIIALTGWLRIIFVWGSLKRGLLDRLENLPIRFAFSRLRSEGRMGMTRQSGLREQWRDMARSAESMRQMINDKCLLNKYPVTDPKRTVLRDLNDGVEKKIMLLRKCIDGEQFSNAEVGLVASANSDLDLRSQDLPERKDGADLALMHSIEVDFAKFGGIVLRDVLIRDWQDKNCSFVERENTDADSSPVGKQAGPDSGTSTPPYIPVAEEFVALRYLSLIRSVLANIRYLMVFVSCTFVLAIVAWNSYPFEPRQLIDWVFTGLLAVLGLGVTWVLAQIHRDAILSRIAKTKANELGAEFYIRIISFGALPLLTWLAYEFPGVGNTILKFLQPGIEVMK
jgi:hypothetical protein